MAVPKRKISIPKDALDSDKELSDEILYEILRRTGERVKADNARLEKKWNEFSNA